MNFFRDVEDRDQFDCAERVRHRGRARNEGLSRAPSHGSATTRKTEVVKMPAIVKGYYAASAAAGAGRLALQARADFCDIP